MNDDLSNSNARANETAPLPCNGLGWEYARWFIILWWFYVLFSSGRSGGGYYKEKSFNELFRVDWDVSVAWPRPATPILFLCVFVTMFNPFLWIMWRFPFSGTDKLWAFGGEGWGKFIWILLTLAMLGTSVWLIGFPFISDGDGWELVEVDPSPPTPPTGSATPPATDEGPCDINPCKNKGTCKLDADKISFNCDCTEGWTGDTCDTPVNKNKDPPPDEG